jgi:hypothetical protein
MGGRPIQTLALHSARPLDGDSAAALVLIRTKVTPTAGGEPPCLGFICDPLFQKLGRPFSVWRWYVPTTSKNSALESIDDLMAAKRAEVTKYLTVQGIPGRCIHAVPGVRCSRSNTGRTGSYQFDVLTGSLTRWSIKIFLAAHSGIWVPAR